MAVNADLFVTERPYIFEARWPVAQGVTLCPVAKAFGVVGLYLRSHWREEVAKKNASAVPVLGQAEHDVELNQTIVFTQPPLPADPAAGTRAAPELRRYERIRAEREAKDEPYGFPISTPDPREPSAVLADVLARDEKQFAALEVWHRELGDADHLGRLDAIWQGETIEARRQG